MSDIFRPIREPAQTLYNALLNAAQKRRSFATCDEWMQHEREVMWQTARDWQQKLGKNWPTMEEVLRAENQAVGHCDYASKFALGVAEAMAAKKVLPIAGE